MNAGARPISPARGAGRGWRQPVLVGVLSAVVGVLAVVGWVQAGRRLDSMETAFTLACLATIALGEAIRPTVDERSTAPISLATGLALGMAQPGIGLGMPPSNGTIVLWVGFAMLLGGALRVLSQQPIGAVDMLSRLLAVATVASIMRLPVAGGRTVLAWAADPAVPPWQIALATVGVAATGIGVDWVGRRLIRRRGATSLRPGMPVDDPGSWGGLDLAVLASGPLILLAEPTVGAWAVPLGLFPLIVAQWAVRRQAAIRLTYRETLMALSRLTDVTGHTTPGHAERVAFLALAMGRSLGLAEQELTALEYAGLLHDLGQVALPDPIPGGATVLAAPADQQRIARDGERIVAQTGVLDEVAGVLRGQTTPYRLVRELGEPLSLSSRILKVANAFDDLTEGSADPRIREVAIERIHLGLGYEYDPAVVAALQEVLAAT